MDFHRDLVLAILKPLLLSPSEVLMVGDDYFSDIYGGKRSNLGTVLVRKKIK